MTIRKIHPLIQQALDEGIVYFHSGNCEWKILVERDEYVDECVGRDVLIFANNGYGDYLFLKYDGPDEFEPAVFEFMHEGQQVEPLHDELDTLLGLRERPTSSDAYPSAKYENGQEVALGDRVQFKTWVSFWKWQEGIVSYVPGQSNKDMQYESDLKWLAIRNDEMEVDPLIDPITGVVKKVRLIERGKTVPKKHKRQETKTSCLFQLLVMVLVLVVLFGAIYLVMSIVEWIKHLVFA